MRTREPPAILQPSALMTYNPLKALQQRFMNMAYKHPQLLIGDEKCDSEKVESTPIAGSGSDNESMVMKTDDNFTNNQTECERSTFKVNIFNGNGESKNAQQMSEQRNSSLNKNCHLIGNVKPNLIKTWEKLNGTPAQQTAPYQNGSDDQSNVQPRDAYINPSIYTNSKYHLFSKQQLANLPIENNIDESFVIRRLPSTSGYFFDSIEAETQDDDDVDDDENEQEVIASLCDELGHGGEEAMAEYISLIEKKEKHCWSIDSCN